MGYVNNMRKTQKILKQTHQQQQQQKFMNVKEKFELIDDSAALFHKRDFLNESKWLSFLNLYRYI